MEMYTYQNGDEDAILDLFERSFGQKMSKDYWRWRFLDNPVYSTPMILLMWDKNRLVGHYAASPIKMSFYNEIRLTALSMTTMTDPEYGGRGIFSKLAQGLYDDMYQQHGISHVWGFPNLQSHYGFRKRLKWLDVLHIPQLTLRNFRKLKPSLEVKSIKDIEFTEKHAIATKKWQVGKGEVFVVKDVAYLNWRYRTIPSEKYQLFQLEGATGLQFAVTKTYEEGKQVSIDVVEYMGLEDVETFSSFLHAMLDFYTEQKKQITAINMWIKLGNPLYQTCEKLGFMPETPITYLGYRSLAGNETLKKESDWLFSMGDSDVY